MTTATKARTRTVTRQIRGVFNEYGYQIIDIETYEILYEAGNNPMDSGPSQSLAVGKGAADIDTIRQWCDQTGAVMALESGDCWRGSAQEDFK
jgi:hypothetical protein